MIKHIALGLTALGAGSLYAQQPAQADGDQPNLLFIFADQFRRASLGFLGEDPVHTPNLDRLAGEGLFLSDAVSNHPLSSPYRGMLLTGKYPLMNGVIANCNSLPARAQNHLKKEEVCFTDVLSQGGYNVGYVGKWHLDSPPVTAPGETVVWDSWCPPDRRHGIDYWYGYGTDNNHMRPHYWANDTPADEPFYVDQWSAEHEAEVIMEYLRNTAGQRSGERPFALFWSINPPHSDFEQVPDRYRERYRGLTAADVLNRPNVMWHNNDDLPVGDKMVDRNIHHAPDYFAMVDGVDDQIGRVLAELDRQGLSGNTIVVFTADHGEMMGSQGLMHKNVWFAESYNIPFIVRWPGNLPAGGSEDVLISVPDIMPTFLSMMGLGDRVPEAVEGRDLSAILKGCTTVERPEYQLYFGSEPQTTWRGKRGIRTREHLFVVVKDAKREKHYYLYDNLNDPCQMTNLWGADPALDRRLEEKLAGVLRSMDDPWIM